MEGRRTAWRWRGGRRGCGDEAVEEIRSQWCMLTELKQVVGGREVLRYP